MTNGPRWKGNPANVVAPSANAVMKRRIHNARMREMQLRREGHPCWRLLKLKQLYWRGCLGQFAPLAQY